MNETAEQIAQWIAEEWGRCFAVVMESMADHKPSIACDAGSRPVEASESAIYVEQGLNWAAGCAIRMAIPEVVWREVGTRVLKAAGIDEVGRDDALSTFQEVFSQAIAGVAQAITARVSQEVTCGAKSEMESLPEGTTGLAVTIGLTNGEPGGSLVWVCPSGALVNEILRGITAPPDTASAATSEKGSQPSSMSKTFDLLLGVHLPVSVSFGKTSMMVKEVLKLTTGSIVELDRQVTEPVDIIVNNCIIARGEVVVVSGNYGVRVREIVSREQRYETGTRLMPEVAR